MESSTRIWEERRRVSRVLAFEARRGTERLTSSSKVATYSEVKMRLSLIVTCPSRSLMLDRRSSAAAGRTKREVSAGRERRERRKMTERERTDDSRRGVPYLVRSDIYKKLLLFLALLDFKAASFGLPHTILPRLDPLSGHLLLSGLVVLPIRDIWREKN